MNQSLALKYRSSATLDSIKGQPHVVAALRDFVAKPFSRAFMFSGDYGVGKTFTAYALANELGCNTGGNEAERVWSGFYELPSGEQNKDSVRECLNWLHYRPMNKTGWKLLCLNEADKSSTESQTVFLDGLEHLPPQSVVVFTTNQPRNLDARFRDRCLHFEFQNDVAELKAEARQLVKEIWRKETGRKDAPTLKQLGCDFAVGCLSFRGLLARLEPFVMARQ